MGAQYQGRCFDTAADAASAAWSGVGPVIGPGSPPVVSVVEWTGTAWQVASYQSGSLLGTVAAPSIAFASCDVAAGAADGAALAWLVVAAWAGAWALHQLRRAMGW
jgi:hypothetical protein